MNTTLHEEFQVGDRVSYSLSPTLTGEIAGIASMGVIFYYMYFPGLCKDEIYELAAQTTFDHAVDLIKKHNLV